MSLEGYALLGLTALVAALVAVLVYAALRFSAAARAARAHAAPERFESAFLAGAVQEAVGRLRAHEQQMQARAEASERLSDQIIASMTSGLLLVDVDGLVRVTNPAGRRLLRIDAPGEGDYREV